MNIPTKATKATPTLLIPDSMNIDGREVGQAEMIDHAIDLRAPNERDLVDILWGSKKTFMDSCVQKVLRDVFRKKGDAGDTNDDPSTTIGETMVEENLATAKRLFHHEEYSESVYILQETIAAIVWMIMSIKRTARGGVPLGSPKED